jgi:hypothetical protein
MRRKILFALVLTPLVLFLSLPAAAAAQQALLPVDDSGHFEIGFHMGTWNINVIKSLIESNINDTLRDNLSSKFIEAIRTDYPDAHVVNYAQSLTFDSDGSNFGIEARWYPSGKHGTFSLGFALERTNMRFFFPTIDAAVTIQTSAYGVPLTFAPSITQAQFELNPWSYHFSFRWDILPTSPITPYFTVGLGVFSTNYLYDSLLTLTYSGSLMQGSVVVGNYAGVITKSVKQAIDESSQQNNIPQILPILQLSVGIKGKILDFLHVLADFGIWNGLSFRGGVAIRM